MGGGWGEGVLGKRIWDPPTNNQPTNQLTNKQDPLIHNHDIMLEKEKEKKEKEKEQERVQIMRDKKKDKQHDVQLVGAVV